MINQLLNILSLGIRPLYEKNLTYYKVVKNFREKLPRPQNNATTIKEGEREKIGLPLLKGINVVNLASFKTSISESEIDQFFNKLEYFDYSFILFPNYYKKYTSNLMRFKPNAQNGDFNLFMVQQVLKENPLKPLHPIHVFIHHLKWEIKLTSRVYVWWLKLNNKNKI
ncbi:hypothetical protein [Sediminibacterium sp. TEGAF015]|uniref:hypothetical protein n=1 Tax=Sediminibacterium sp. TEGAF015 TaxID=575378 RepID=UPI0021FA1459|nr:hypothetical protein [Sediminibacterium sp. TEGAF015]BDQ12128.1 hypothetical protein TEGAF0_13450 [Sediminibacterium sp. TEGAF015]